MDHQMAGVTVEQFRQALRDATARIDVVDPPALREPVSLWFRSVEAQASSPQWTHLLGRSVVSVWNAAQAILAEDLKQPGGTP